MKVALLILSIISLSLFSCNRQTTSSSSRIKHTEAEKAEHHVHRSLPSINDCDYIYNHKD